MKKTLQFLAVILGLLCASGSSFAGYATLIKPANVTFGSSGTLLRGAVNDVSYAGGVISATGTGIQAGAKFVTLPVAYTYAANAAQFAATAAFGNPLLFLALGAASVAYQYFTDEGYSVIDGVWKKETADGCASNCYTYRVINTSTMYPSASAAVNAYLGSPCSAIDCKVLDNLDVVALTFSYHMHYGSHYNQSSGLWSTPSDSPIEYSSIQRFEVAPTPPTYVPATQTEFINAVSGKPITPGMPQIWPIFPFEWPVNPVPIINPSADPVPVSRPYRVPQGDPVAVPLPVPNPEGLPQTWKTPVIDIVPSSTTLEPWRVDLQPKDIVSLSPDPLIEGAPVSSDPATPSEFKMCGLPGTPACKIDEVGTPEGSADSKFQPTRDALDTKFGELTNLVENPASPSGTGWNLSTSVFGIPSASCSPFVWVSRLGTLEVDVCTNSLVNTMRQMLGWMMYGLTVLYVWRSANEALRGA